MARKKSASSSLSTSSSTDSNLAASPETPLGHRRRTARSSTRANPSRAAKSGPTPRATRSAAAHGEADVPGDSGPAGARAQNTGKPKGTARPKGTGRPQASRPRRKPAATSVRPSATTERQGEAQRVVTDDDVRMRAYFLYLEHGPQGGSELDYWTRAERELRGR